MSDEEYLYHKSLMKSAALEFNTPTKEVVNKTIINKKKYF